MKTNIEEVWKEIHELSVNISPEVWNPLLEEIYNLVYLSELDGYRNGKRDGHEEAWNL